MADTKVKDSNYYNEKVKYTAPLVPGVLEDDLIVILNGVSYQIRRGEECEIPRKVMRVIERSEAAERQAVNTAREKQALYLKAEKALI